jgi:hypothetical protein
MEEVERPPENVEEEALAAFADEPKPPEEGPPKTIDFQCQWCESDLHMPLDMAGKQTQCPNEECRRIIKVPLPKVEGKKDWRKMNRQGPAAALVNQVEALDDAWGTENTTKARQASLEQAGVIVDPSKKPRWLRRIAIGACGLMVLCLAVYGGMKLRTSNEQHRSIKEIEDWVNPHDTKIKDSVLRAEALRALGLLYLHEAKGSGRQATPAEKSAQNFLGALGLLKDKIEEDKYAVNEQLFLIDLALSQLELAGNEDEYLAKIRWKWPEVYEKLLSQTLGPIKSPDVKVLALREVGTRLVEKDQKTLAIQLAGSLSEPDEKGATPPAQRQFIALVYALDLGSQFEIPREPSPTPKEDEELIANERVGFAEGYARKQEFDKALALAKAKGAASDRFDALIGVAWVALQARNKDKAKEFFNEALRVAKEPDPRLSEWQHLQLIKLGARLEENDTAKELLAKMPPSPFKLRGQLEIFLAKCDKGADAKLADDLTDLDHDDKEGSTLGLAWAALARQSGATRDQNRKTLDGHVGTPTEIAPLLRMMVDIGSALGARKQTSQK